MITRLNLPRTAALLLAANSAFAADAASVAGAMFAPKIDGGYVLVYKPEAGVYSGPSTAHYKQGLTYSDWRPNDHTFIKGRDGRWHCFGITKPEHAPGETGFHEAEGTAFHAVAPAGVFARAAFRPGAFVDRTKLTVGDCGHAPFAFEEGGAYHIVGSKLGHATSPDLDNWSDRGKLGVKGLGRDPYVLLLNGVYHLYRCANMDGVSLVTSKDFLTWTEPVIVFKPAIATRQTESPSVIPYAGRYYLFWCLWDNEDPTICDKGAKPGYCARTFVYCSDKADDFRNAPLVAQLPSHAPEVFQDEQGQWYVSSADYPATGVQVARLKWEDFRDEAKGAAADGQAPKR